jgi:hypothetical protein
VKKVVSGSENGGQKRRILILVVVMLPLLVLLWASKANLPAARKPISVAGAGQVAHSLSKGCSAASVGTELCMNAVGRPTVKVPEPTPLLLVGTGLLSVAVFIRKKIMR